MIKVKDAFLTLFLFNLILLAGCDIRNYPKESRDVEAFKNLITLEFPVTNIQWEIIGTPENTIGVPGPTDYVSLVAEIEPVNEGIFTSLSPNKKIWIASKAARPWMDENSRTFLTKNKNTVIDVSAMENCRTISAKLTKSNTPVTGVICRNKNKMLMHITIADYTGMNENVEPGIQR